jgi:cobalt-zinc-cadmium efflux system outer membrane protein
VDQAVRLALQGNPDVKSARAAVSAAEAREKAARIVTQGNPKVELAIGPRTRPEERSLDLALSIEQPIEIAGQQTQRRDSAREAVRAARARLELSRVSVATEVREAFARALAATEERAIAADSAALARSGVVAADDRYRSGAASRIEVNTARVEVGRAARAELQAAQAQAAALARLRLLVGIDAAAPLELTGTLRTSRSRRQLDLTDLLTQARQKRPDLLAARFDLDAARAALALSAREAVPNLRLGALYAREERAHIVEGTLGIDLPLFNRNQAARADAAARVRQADLEAAALEQRIAQEVRLAADRLVAAWRTSDAFSTDVVKASQENVDLVTEGYKAGQIDFLQLILIRRDTLEARRGHVETLEELMKAEAQLDRVVGKSP